MGGFRKAQAEQAALKVGIYGPTGSGKTFTTLLMLEGLAKLTGKRVAYVDTERGTDFYAKHVPDRKVHPEAFDFDALYSRSLTEVLKECRQLQTRDYCAVAVDSITHLWEAAIAAYTGGRTRAGTIPMHAWGGIKRPYKELMHWMLNTPLHVFILGRQGNEWGEGDDGELVNTGYKMKAEGETAYEPHVLVRMEAVKPRPAKGKRPDPHAVAVPTAFVEKDRSGILFGRLVEWPSFDNVVRPLLGVLGQTQAQQPSEEETGARDAEALAAQERERDARLAAKAQPARPNGQKPPALTPDEVEEFGERARNVLALAEQTGTDFTTLAAGMRKYYGLTTQEGDELEDAVGRLSLEQLRDLEQRLSKKKPAATAEAK